MPKGDGTGPVNQRLIGGGRGRGGGMSRGVGFTGPSRECQCPKCGYHEIHKGGIPCNNKRCPKCNNPMIRT